MGSQGQSDGRKDRCPMTPFASGIRAELVHRSAIAEP
jgi:hypothetical protein